MNGGAGAAPVRENATKAEHAMLSSM